MMTSKPSSYQRLKNVIQQQKIQIADLSRANVELVRLLENSKAIWLLNTANNSVWPWAWTLSRKPGMIPIYAETARAIELAADRRMTLDQLLNLSRDKAVGILNKAYAQKIKAKGQR